VGYVGHRTALPVLVAGLRRLEYRGYDSAGVAVLDGAGALEVVRAAGPLDNLVARLGGVTAGGTAGMGHTRWASVGIISQANTHPLNSDEVGRTEGPYVTAALNGDVDNYADLRLSEILAVPEEVTTDAKVIPTLVSHRMAEGSSATEAFAHTVARFHGSVAIGASVADTPDQLLLALRGSGQGLYIGLAEDAFVVASEPYGLIEETSRGPGGLSDYTLWMELWLRARRDRTVRRNYFRLNRRERTCHTSPITPSAIIERNFLTAGW